MACRDGQTGVYEAWPFRSVVGVNVTKPRPAVIILIFDRYGDIFKTDLEQTLRDQGKTEWDLDQYELVVASEAHKTTVKDSVGEVLEVVVETEILQDLVQGDAAHEVMKRNHCPSRHWNWPCLSFSICGYVVRKACTIDSSRDAER